MSSTLVAQQTSRLANATRGEFCIPHRLNQNSYMLIAYPYAMSTPWLSHELHMNTCSLHPCKIQPKLPTRCFQFALNLKIALGFICAATQTSLFICHPHSESLTRLTYDDHLFFFCARTNNYSTELIYLTSTTTL